MFENGFLWYSELEEKCNRCGNRKWNSSPASHGGMSVIDVAVFQCRHCLREAVEKNGDREKTGESTKTAEV